MTEYEIIRFFKFLLTIGIGFCLWEAALRVVMALRKK